MSVDTLVEERSALDLYGGREEVIERMNSLTRQKLRLVSEDYRKYIYAELQEDKGSERFIEFLDGKRRIDFEIFDMFKDSYLDMDINEILGKPDLSDPSVRGYWKHQMRINPMLISGHKSADVRRESPKDLAESELRFYVKLRAISELALDK